MSDQNNSQETAGPETPQSGSTGVDNSWQEVGKQFQELGQALSQAFRTAWDSEENQRRVEGLRTGLESMVNSVSKAIDDTASSPQGQKVKTEAERTVEAVRNAGEQTVQEVRPQLINALQQVNTELQKLVERMEARRPAAPPERNPDEPDVQI